MKLIRSFGYAFNGLKHCFSSERNFRIHLIIAVMVMLLGFVFRIPVAHWLLVLFSMALVLALEMMNTAMEKMCDLVSGEILPAIKMIKDISAGAVLVAALLSVAVGLLVFSPPILHYIHP